jgi:hypothetical protein
VVGDTYDVVSGDDVVSEVVDAAYVVDADIVGTVSVVPAVDGV